MGFRRFISSAAAPAKHPAKAWLGTLGAAALGVVVGKLLSSRPPVAPPPPSTPTEPAVAPLLKRLNHELRTPLNAITGLTHLLLQQPPPAQQQEYLHSLQQATTQLLTAFTNLVESDLPAAEPAAQAALPPFAPPLRVLVAEDNELNQLVVQHMLEAWQVRVTMVPDGQQAVAAALQHSFDAVLMDVDMPVMNGNEATRLLRQHFPTPGQLPIIGLTAATQPAEVQAAQQAGMTLTLAKPVDPAVLHHALRQATGHQAAPPAPQPQWQRLEELANGNTAFLRRVMAVFLEQAPVQLAILQDAHSAADLPTLASHLHKLRGQLAYFGFDELTAGLLQAERLAKAQDTAALPLAAELLTQLPAIFPPIRARYESLPA